jgi:3D (Asp-Asp-Asp) domain-containing protein
MVLSLLIDTASILFATSKRVQQGTKTRRNSEVYTETVAHNFSCSYLLRGFTAADESEKSMKWLVTALGLISICACQAFAGEHSALARVTVYWPGEGSGARAAWNGARLNEQHCAVNPKKIPYGSKVAFHDAECLAVDTGPDVVNRKAARSCGRNATERNAVVIDRFFDTKERALAWAKTNPDFMMVRVRTPDAYAAD